MQIKKREKSIAIFGAIATAATLLAVGHNLDKIKKFLQNLSSKRLKNSAQSIVCRLKELKAPWHNAKTKTKPKKSLKLRLFSNLSQKYQNACGCTTGQNAIITKHDNTINASNRPAIRNIILSNNQNTNKPRNIIDSNGQTLYRTTQNNIECTQKTLKKTVLQNTQDALKNYNDILALTNKENLKSQDLRKIEEIFKQHTGINLYCPESYNFKDFEGFFEPMIKYNMYNRLNPEIKHIVIGHGTGSAAEQNWRFESNKKDVFDFIESRIPKGEKVLLVTCESSKATKPGIGGPVNISLHAKNRPGKIVESGIRNVIGTAYLLEPNIIRFFDR